LKVDQGRGGEFETAEVSHGASALGAGLPDYEVLSPKSVKKPGKDGIRPPYGGLILSCGRASAGGMLDSDALFIG
jgi:hypothetical protein